MGDGNVSVFINKGNGTFALPRCLTPRIGGHPAVVLGDFNGDGKLDIAVPNVYAKDESIFYNNGNGTFAPQVTYATGEGGHAELSGDLNGDGSPDLFSINREADTISVLMSKPGGGFAPAVNYSTAQAVFGIMTDVNGDGHPDIVAGTETGVVEVFMNQGDGTLAAPVDYATTGETNSYFAAGDVNGDGKVDIIETTFTNSGNGTVSVLMNNGNGTFAAPVNYATGSGASAVTLGLLSGSPILGQIYTITSAAATPTPTTITISASPAPYGGTGIVSIAATAVGSTPSGTVTLSVDGGSPISQTLIDGLGYDRPHGAVSRHSHPRRQLCGSRKFRGKHSDRDASGRTDQHISFDFGSPRPSSASRSPLPRRLLPSLQVDRHPRARSSSSSTA